MPADRYAHLRANLAQHHAVHTTRTAIEWCRTCQEHHADETGLCPVCKPVEDVRWSAGDVEAA